jgi:hypothetical protein
VTVYITYNPKPRSHHKLEIATYYNILRYAGTHIISFLQIVNQKRIIISEMVVTSKTKLDNQCFNNIVCRLFADKLMLYITLTITLHLISQ